MQNQAGLDALAWAYPRRGCNIDTPGRYLLAAGQLSYGMSSYKIDADSEKRTKFKEYPMGKKPHWVEIVDIPSFNFDNPPLIITSCL